MKSIAVNKGLFIPTLSGQIDYTRCAQLGLYLGFPIQQRVSAYTGWVDFKVGRKYFGQCYLRRSKRCLGGENLITSIEIANITYLPDHRGCGEFARFLRYLYVNANEDVIYVESVLNEHLPDYLLRNGFTLDYNPNIRQGEGQSYYIRRNEKDKMTRTFTNHSGKKYSTETM